MKKTTGFLLGGAIGAGIALLFTTKKGEELRKSLAAKFDELIDKAKEIDPKEVKANIEKKVNEIKAELKDLDKEKVKEIAVKKGEQIKAKAEDLVVYAKEKGTPVLEKTANAARLEAIKVVKEVLKKLEAKE